MSIVTLTMNPAIDVASATDSIRPTEKMRCTAPRFDPGGGGINVARTVAELGERVTAVFPVGGPEGEKLRQLVREARIPMRAIAVTGSTRQNIAVTDDRSQEQYRFVFPGARLTTAEAQRCLAAVEQAARDARFVVASGSLPPAVGPDFYQQLADTLGDQGVPLILDTSGAPFRAMRAGVYLMKPSARELADFAGHPLPDRAATAAAARAIIESGLSENVVVSLGSEGALLVTPTDQRWFEATRAIVRSGIGAGDAMVGGISVGLLRHYPISDAVRLGIAAATAALSNPGTGPGHRSRIAELFHTTDPYSDETVHRSPT